MLPSRYSDVHTLVAYTFAGGARCSRAAAAPLSRYDQHPPPRFSRLLSAARPYHANQVRERRGPVAAYAGVLLGKQRSFHRLLPAIIDLGGLALVSVTNDYSRNRL